MTVDLHSEQERAGRFAVLSGAGFYLAGVAGPLLFGQLVGKLDLWTSAAYSEFQLPFMVNLCANVAALLLVLVGLKETLPKSDAYQRSFDDDEDDGGHVALGAGRKPMVSYLQASCGTLHVLCRFKVLFSMFTLLCLGQAGVFGIIPIYAQLAQFELTSVEIGYLLSVGSFGQCLSILCLSPLLARLQSKYQSQAPLLWIARAGAVFMATFILLYGLCAYLPAQSPLPPKTALFAVAAFSSLSAIWDPCLRSSLSISASACGETQGNVLGGLASLQNLVNLIAPFMWNGLYSATATLDPALCFFVGSGVALFALLPSFLSQVKPLGPLSASHDHGDSLVSIHGS